MPKKTVNIALIGKAFMGKTHSNAWRQVRHFFDPPAKPVMKVLCDVNLKETQEAAEVLGWEEVSTDWKEVVHRDDIDIIDLATPNFLHAPMAIEAAKAGKHIVCEKPLANTLKEAEQMLKAAQKAGVKHLCGFTYRFNPAIQSMKKMIAGGELGEIFHVRATYQQDWIVDPNFPLNWRLEKPTAGSGALGDIGAHITDLAQFLVGEIAEVSAATETFVKERPIVAGGATIDNKKTGGKAAKKGAVTVDDAAVYIARFKGMNTLGTFEATRFAPGRRNYNSVEIYGAKGSLIWNQEDMHQFLYYNGADKPDRQGFRKILATDPAHPYTGNWWPSGHNIGYEHLFVHEMYEFLRQLDSKTVTYPTFEDGVKCQRVLEAVEKAARTRRWEKV